MIPFKPLSLVKFSYQWNGVIVPIATSLNMPRFRTLIGLNPSDRSSRESKRSEDPNRRLFASSVPVITKHFVLVTMTYLFRLHFNIGFHLFDDSFLVLLFTPNRIFFISCQNFNRNRIYRVLKCTDRNHTKEMKVTSHCAQILHFARARACCRGDVTTTQYALISTFSAFPTSYINYKKSKAEIKNPKWLKYGHDVFLPPWQKSRRFNSICSRHMCTANGRIWEKL